MGAGAFAKEVLLYLSDLGALEKCVGFLDDEVSKPRFASQLPVLGRTDDYEPSMADSVVVCIGNPLARGETARKIIAKGGALGTVVHPTAYVAKSASIQSGTVLAPFVFVGPDASIGRNVVLNTYASVGHDAAVGEDCVLSPYAVVNGDVKLGKSVFLGTHSVVLVGVDIGPGCKIAAGSVATRDLPPGHLAVGNPARSREMFQVEI